ncbi:MAG: Gfo/Idh/MocA family oxidoreductase [Pseudomonadota bacterium]
MTLNVALIGAGMVAKTHVDAIKDASSVELSGLLARRAKSAERFAQDIESGAKIYESIQEIASDPALDFAIVATPPNARLDLIRPLAEAGKPILLEKPVARTLAEATEVVELCESHAVPLGIVFQHRMREASLKAKQLIDGGTLGALGFAELNVPWWREQGYYDEPGRGTYERDGGGVLISQAIHTIDLALSLTGPVSKVQAMTGRTRFHDMESEDVANAGLTFVNGALGFLTASTASFPGGAETITLHHENASLHLGSGVLTVTWRDGRTDTFGASATTGGGADPMAFTHGWHQSIIEDFADAIQTNRPPAITGRAALDSHRLIDAITRSSNLEKAVEVSL